MAVNPCIGSGPLGGYVRSEREMFEEQLRQKEFYERQMYEQKHARYYNEALNQYAQKQEVSELKQAIDTGKANKRRRALLLLIGA